MVEPFYHVVEEFYHVVERFYHVVEGFDHVVEEPDHVVEKPDHATGGPDRLAIRTNPSRERGGKALERPSATANLYHHPAMDDAHAFPPFPGPLGPPGEVESLRRFLVERVTRDDLRAIAAGGDWTYDRDRWRDTVLELLAAPWRLDRWPAVADAGAAATVLQRVCFHALGRLDTAPQREYDRLLFAAAMLVIMRFDASYPADGFGTTMHGVWTARLVVLAAALGPQAVAAVRPFIAWMREAPPDPEINVPEDFDLPLLLLDAAMPSAARTRSDPTPPMWPGIADAHTAASVDDERTVRVWLMLHDVYGRDAECSGMTTVEAFFDMSLEDPPADVCQRIGASLLAMAPCGVSPNMAELLASMVERREPAF